MQVISRRILREFCNFNPDTRGSLLAWQRLLSSGEFENFAAVQQLFKGAHYIAPYVVFLVGRNVRVIAVVHYSRRRVYVRNVFTRIQYEAWSGRAQRKDGVRECLEIDRFVVGRSGVAHAGIALPREVVRHHERPALPGHERIHESASG
jgi:mRNA interferase HigB